MDFNGFILQINREFQGDVSAARRANPEKGRQEVRPKEERALKTGKQSCSLSKMFMRKIHGLTNQMARLLSYNGNKKFFQTVELEWKKNSSRMKLDPIILLDVSPDIW